MQGLHFDATPSCLRGQSPPEAQPSLDRSGQNPTEAGGLNPASGNPAFSPLVMAGFPEAGRPPVEDREISTGGLSTSPPPWSKKQKRAYHRIKSLLKFWLSHDYQVLWVCLTSSPNSDAKALAYHHQILRQRIERELGYPGVEHFQVRTKEGYGVLHCFWAWRERRPGFRQRSFYVPQDWLSRAWEEIHGAKIVWVCRLRKSKKSIKIVSAYAVSQYCAGQSKFERMSWSWKRSLGFPMVRVWNWIRSRYEDLHDSLLIWDLLLSGAPL